MCARNLCPQTMFHLSVWISAAQKLCGGLIFLKTSFSIEVQASILTFRAALHPGVHGLAAAQVQATHLLIRLVIVLVEKYCARGDLSVVVASAYRGVDPRDAPAREQTLELLAKELF